MHAAPWSPARSRQHTPNLHGDSLMTTGSTVISGSTRFVAGHVSREASGYPSEDGLQSRPLTASLDLDGTETGSLTSFLTKPRGLLVGRGEGDGGAKGGLHGARSMRNLRGGANVLNPRRGKLLEDLKQRSFMFSQSHKSDAREVGKRMREEWVSVKIREHPDLGIYVEPLCELSVKNPDDIFRLLDQGNKVRRVASTQMNERSSRSHSVFTVKIQQKTAVEEDGVRRETALASKLNLVDLAGSERASKTGAEGSWSSCPNAASRSTRMTSNISAMMTRADWTSSRQSGFTLP
jgi:hypothetical protein